MTTIKRPARRGKGRTLASGLLLILVSGAASCGAPLEALEPEAAREPDTSEAAITGPELLAAYAVYSKYKGYADKAISLWDMLQGSLDPARDLAMEINDLERRVLALEQDLRALGRDLSARLDTIEFSARDNLVKSLRAQAQSALQFAADHDTEVTAHGVARSLENWDLYHYSARYPGQAERFDPRITVVSFMTATNIWLTVRGIRKVPMDDAARRDLLRFIERLEAVASQTSAKLSCEQIFYTDETEVRVKHDVWRPVYSCHFALDCRDEIAASHLDTGKRGPGILGQTLEDVRAPTSGQCSREDLQYRRVDFEAAHLKASERYFLSAVEETARAWREVAAQ